MTTLEELEQQLPWGFHDAHLEALTIDWLEETLTLVLRLPLTQHQDLERRAQVTVSGLYFCSIDPPDFDARERQTDPRKGLRIDAMEGAARGAVGLPPLPAGVFVHHLLVRPWNFRTLHIAGRDARLEWLSDAAPRVGGGSALFPGEPLPKP